MQSNEQKLTEIEIQNWFKSRLSELFELELDEIDTALPLYSYNIDSTMTVGLTSDLEELLGYNLEPTILYEHPTIEEISRYLSNYGREGGTANGRQL